MMSAIGPELPPHLLAKRKRIQEEQTEDAPTTASGAKRSSSLDSSEKRRRVIGPAMPPAPLDERPNEPPARLEESESEEEDGFGPTLPPKNGDEDDTNEGDNNRKDGMTSLELMSGEQKPKRDEWMTMPPKQDDLAARMDPTKQRPHAFNTGKGARGLNPVDNDSSTWHETPEQKRKRLADEMMGVSKVPSSIVPQKSNKPSDAGGEYAKTQKIREHAEKTRGPSLMHEHSVRNKDSETDDDPSKRVFDREKDMGSGMRIGHSQRQEMLKKASDFSSKFSGGSYL